MSRRQVSATTCEGGIDDRPGIYTCNLKLKSPEEASFNHYIQENTRKTNVEERGDQNQHPRTPPVGNALMGRNFDKISVFVLINEISRVLPEKHIPQGVCSQPIQFLRHP